VNDKWAGITNKQLFLYALPAIPIIALGFPINFYVGPYFTTELGVSLTGWATVILLARIWDIITDPIAGVICDRVRTRWGRRRHWLVLAAPILMVSCVLLFMPNLFVDKVTILYALFAMCLLQVGQTIFGLNHQAWGAELSYEYHERSRIQGWRAIVGGVAPLIALSIPLFIELTSDAPELANGDKLFYIAIFVLVALPTFTMICVTNVKERPGRIQVDSNKKTDLLESWKLLLKNLIMVRLITIDIFAALPFSIASAITYFYVAYILKAPWAMAAILISAFVVNVLAMPVWIRLSRHFEKHRLLTFCYLMGALIQPLMLFLGPGDVIYYAIITGLNGAFILAPGFLLRSIVADVVDSDTIATGEERAGTFYALIELTQKFIPAIAVPLVFPYLAWMGFQPELGSNNTPEAINALKYAYVIFPPIPMLIAAYLLYTFPLGQKEQKENRKQIDSVYGSSPKA